MTEWVAAAENLVRIPPKRSLARIVATCSSVRDVEYAGATPGLERTSSLACGAYMRSIAHARPFGDVHATPTPSAVSENCRPMHDQRSARLEQSQPSCCGPHRAHVDGCSSIS